MFLVLSSARASVGRRVVGQRGRLGTRDHLAGPAGNMAARRMTDADRTDLLRRYAAGEIRWRELQERGFADYVEVLGGLGELGLRPPMAPMTGPQRRLALAGHRDYPRGAAARGPAARRRAEPDVSGPFGLISNKSRELIYSLNEVVQARGDRGPQR